MSRHGVDFYFGIGTGHKPTRVVSPAEKVRAQPKPRPRSTFNERPEVGHFRYPAPQAGCPSCLVHRYCRSEIDDRAPHLVDVFVIDCQSLLVTIATA